MHQQERRRFVKTLVAAAAAIPAHGLAMQSTPGSIKALVFDAYGTLFDVFSVTSLCEQMFPGNGTALAMVWRSKQLQYTLLRSMMNRYEDFWQVTRDGLVYAANALRLDLDVDKRTRLMDAYMTLAAFPDVKPGLQQLKAMGLRLAVLSNGAPEMLESAARSAGEWVSACTYASPAQIMADDTGGRAWAGTWSAQAQWRNRRRHSLRCR